jgi:hypothetical protein
MLYAVLIIIHTITPLMFAVLGIRLIVSWFCLGWRSDKYPRRGVHLSGAATGLGASPPHFSFSSSSLSSSPASVTMVVDHSRRFNQIDIFACWLLSAVPRPCRPLLSRAEAAR